MGAATTAEAFDAMQRKQATKDLNDPSSIGLPVRRDCVPGLRRETMFIAYPSTTGRSVRMSSAPDERPRTVTSTVIASTLSTEYIHEEVTDTDRKNPYPPADQSIVCLDRRVFNAIKSSVAESEKLPDGTKRQFELLAAYKFSSRICVLTDLLYERFWTPEDAPVETIDFWCEAFDVENSKAGWFELMELAISPIESRAGYLKKFYQDRLKAEAYLLGSAWFRSNVGCYRQLNFLGGLDNVLTHLDPILRERSVLTGATTRIEAAPDQQSFIVDGPLKTKVDRSLLIVADENMGPKMNRAKVREIWLDADRKSRLRLDDEIVQKVISTPAMRRDQIGGYAVEAPVFIGKASATRWARPGNIKNSDGEPVSKISRKVPIHIELAAAIDR